MRKMLMLFASLLIVSSVFAEDYNPGADFHVDAAWNFNGDANFSDFTVIGGHSVLAGMDFDSDSLFEVLFVIDETLAPGGPDPGKLGVYLYESDGNGGYTYVWHFVTPDPGNSLPGMNYGDIDGDGNHEIYFGVPPSVGNNTNSWGTYIFEQGADGVFPTTPTMLWQHANGATGLTETDNFRPSSYQIADVDGDGKNELITTDRGMVHLTIDALVGNDLDDLATMANEYFTGGDGGELDGGGIYDMDVVDFDGDGLHEVWVNTWDNFSMAIYEATGADSYRLANDLNEMFIDNDPGSFNRVGFAFHDIDGDDDLEAWFPMTNGKLYYLEAVSDSTDSAHFAVGGVDSIKASHFHEILTFGGNTSRGGDVGDIDGNGKPDIIVGTGTAETVVRIEYQGSDPTDPFSYMVSTILESQGGDPDRWYSLDISDNDLDGDGNLEVVVPNIKGVLDGQAQIVVLDHYSFEWDWTGAENGMTHLDPNWSLMAVSDKAIHDSLFQTDPTGNSRTAIGGMDMDQDGKHEVIITDYAGGRVIVYEYDVANSAFDVVWMSPVVESRNHSYNPRTVNVGDLDGDGKHEIVFPSSHVDAEGFHIYEWDGVAGSDNYGTQPSSICKTEVEVCCGDDGSGFRGDHERIDIFDIDGDGQQELITAIRRGSPRGTIISSLGATDDIEHNSGGGLETWSQEFLTNNDHYGGGSPYQALPADLNGDGRYELVNHHWNNFLFYTITATGADAYVAPDTGAAAVDAFYKATGNDQVSLFGGNAYDVDGDGNHEAYFHSYGSWGVGAGDVWVVDYDAADTNAYEVSGTDTTWHALPINANHVSRVGNTGTFSGDIGTGYNGTTNPYIFAGRGRPNVQALEYIGGDPSHGQSYMKRVIYWGEMDVTQGTTLNDSLGNYSVTHSSAWGFPSKVQTNWGGTMLDFDGDGKNELLLSMQNVKDSLTNTVYNWNGSGMDTSTYTYANPKAWTVILLENSENTLSNEEEPITFIAPEQYKLSQNYPNPFNPNTTIEYTIPINRKVSVKIYNVSGQLVNTLVDNQYVDAGTHKIMWDGRNSNGTSVATGMYFYSLEWAGMKKVKSMTLLK